MPLITFQPNGDRDPLIGIHIDTGEVSWLIPLVLQRGADLPTYGLEAASFSQQYQPHKSIEAMAAHYVRAILTTQLQGSIRLMGYGIGATIAFEMACQLYQQGQDVSHLYLLDPYLPTTEILTYWIDPVERDSIFRLTLVANTLGSMWGSQEPLKYEQIARAQNPVQQIASFLLQKTQCPMPPEKLPSWINQSAAGLRTTLETLKTYQPKPYQGEAEVWIVQSQLDRLLPDNRYGLPPHAVQATDLAQAWQTYVPNTVRIHEFGHDRFQLLQPNHLQSLYQRLTAAGGRLGSAAEKGGYIVQASELGQWTPNVVPINKNGSQQASFWVHTLLADVSYGVNLSRYLGIDYPLFGLEQFDVAGGIHLTPNLEEMAAAYIRGMKKVQPQGPYIVGGYSFGGVVAYEMARQLIQTGHEVSRVIMFDSFMPNTDTFESIDTKAFGDTDFSIMGLLLIGNTFGDRWQATHPIVLDDIAGRELDWQIRRVAQHLYDNSQTLLDYRDIHRLVESVYQTIMTNNDALLGYTPKKLPASTRVLLFHATLGFVGPDNANGTPEVKVMIDDRSNGFGSFVEGTLDIYDLPADHYTICNDEFIKMIATHLK